ncbi:TetR/AcrR family transcriptional regulator [Allokutzneria sp. A3M-2-11 16]|uniref:TetR/AcrR family transcriptional regulator n=1 Tax=Allokutzneria sp. A3M-2-11 16 TaxID=2962043 RepID=UPI0020B66CA8|nr:TetR/AcrR family transcriptional regulator [Allokutzneria sp. A3M-2-11 16]MCP3804756.1 TetR/AcrR family transcriptional regulator [Allokutzneria sp. A3M-2-11 16]
MPSTTRESGSRSRTRRAILDAAIALLATRPQASLAEVADAAGVGRSTLHRYFPERTELLSAVVEDSMAQLTAAVAAAELDRGTPAQGLRRIIHTYFELSPVLLVLFGEHLIDTRKDLVGDLDELDAPVFALLERGQREGYFDAEVSKEWLNRVLWAVVYVGIDATAEGTMTRHAALESITRTLEHGMLARPGA